MSELKETTEQRTRVLCIAPAWNEGERISRVVREVPRKAVEKIVVVDDGSTDDTARHAQKAGAVVLRQRENRGVGAAIRRGVEYGIENGYTVAVILSGSGKTPPRQIPRLLEPILRGEADLVQGSRYISGGEFLRMPLGRWMGTRAYTWLFSLFLGQHVTDASSGFRAIRLSLFDDEQINLRQPWLDRYELEPYLLFKTIRRRHRVVEVPVTIQYPEKSDPLAYTKMRALVDWWNIFRPVLFLALHIKK